MIGISSLSSSPSVTPPIIAPQAENNPLDPPLSSEADNPSHNDGQQELLQKIQALQTAFVQQSNLVSSLNNQLLKGKEEYERLRSQFHLQFNKQFESRGAVDTSYSLSETVVTDSTTTETAEPETGNLGAFRDLLQTTVGSIRARDEAHRVTLTSLRTQRQKNEELTQTLKASDQEKINQLEATKKEAALETNAKNAYQRTVQAFIDILENKEQSTISRCEVASVFGIQPELYDDIRFALEEVLQDENEEVIVRTEVAIALGRHRALSPGEMSILLEAVKNKTLSAVVRYAAVVALSYQLVLNKEPELLEAIHLALQAVLQDENVEVKAIAAIALGQHQPLFPAEMSILLEAVKNKTLRVVIGDAAVGALGQQLVLNKVPELVEVICLALQEVLQDENVEVAVRTKAAIALGQHQALAPAEMSILFEAVKNKTLNMVNRRSAVIALDHQLLTLNKGPELIKAICLALQAVLQDENVEVEVKAIAAIALGQNQALSPAEMSIVFEAVKNKTLRVADRCDAAWTLGQQLVLNKEPKLLEAIRLVLQAVLQDENVETEVKTQATRSFGRCQALSPAEMSIVFEAVKDKTLPVADRENAVWVLGQQLLIFNKEPELLEAIRLVLQHVLQDENEAVTGKTLAAIALGQHQALSPTEMSILFEAVKNKTLPVVTRRNAALTLGQQLVLNKVPERIEAIRLVLQAVLQDENVEVEVKAIAAIALGQHQPLSPAEMSILFEAMKNKTLPVVDRCDAAWVLGQQLVFNEVPEEIEAIRLALQDVLQDENVETEVKTQATAALDNFKNVL